MSTFSSVVFIALLAGTGMASAQSPSYGSGASLGEYRPLPSTELPEREMRYLTPDQLDRNEYNDPTVPNRAAGTRGPNRAVASPPDIFLSCAPSAVNCPVTGASGGPVTTTDALPIGSTGDRDPGDPISESQYPVSPGVGAMGSGITGAPTGPSSEPPIGIGR